VFLMAGTIDLAKKAQDLGLRAFARVAQSAPRPVGLLVAGAGAGEAELKRLAVKLGVEHSVAFLGWQEPDDMDVVFLASDVLVHPAHYDPFPLVVIEAMSFGCAVIGSDHCGSIEERVTDGINGYSFPAGDADALIGSMQRLVLDLSHLASVKREARKTAETWPMDRGVEIVRRTMDSLIHREHR
jgi:glycosyltransferase involved in cell wall biosynthesis